MKLLAYTNQTRSRYKQSSSSPVQDRKITLKLKFGAPWISTMAVMMDYLSQSGHGSIIHSRINGQ